MATTVPFENELLKLIFNATPIPGVADNATTTPDTEYFVALHTEDPTKSPLPLQTSAEIAYTAYARQAVPRTELGWEIDQGKVIPVEIIEFPEVTGVVGSVRTATHFSVGTDVSGGGKVMFSGLLKPAITIANGAQPRIDNQSVASRFDESWA